MQGEITWFIYVWDFTFFLFEYLCPIALITVIITRNVHKCHLFKHLYITELDESIWAMKQQAGLLKPLQEETERNRFNDELID